MFSLDVWKSGFFVKKICCICFLDSSNLWPKIDTFNGFNINMALENNYVFKFLLKQVSFCLLLVDQILSPAHWKINLQIAKLARSLFSEKYFLYFCD